MNLSELAYICQKPGVEWPGRHLDWGESFYEAWLKLTALQAYIVRE